MKFTENIEPSTWRVEPPTFWENRVLKWESESLTLPTKLNWQAAYFFMLAVYFKTYWELWVVALSRLSHTRVSHPLLPAVLLCKLTTIILLFVSTPPPLSVWMDLLESWVWICYFTMHWKALLSYEGLGILSTNIPLFGKSQYD